MAIGNKAKNLRILETIGMPVPPFVSFSPKKIPTEFPKANLYAVRSSMANEDGASAQAGQYHSELRVPADKLSASINKVIKQAQDKGLKESEIGIIVQEFIEPDYAGVIFTRNPLNGPEMIFEYHQGSGEDLVGGKIQAKKMIISATSQLEKWQKNLLELSKKVERYFAFPQDIEWCLLNQKIFILQTRNITTLTPQNYNGYIYLEKLLSEKYFLEKSLDESVPKIDKNTFDLLKKIYATNGPIAKTYAKYGIKYQYTDFLQILNGELYIDKERELQSLKPACSLLSTAKIEEKFVRLKGLLTTLTNSFKLGQINGNIEELKEKLEIKLKTVIKTEKEFLADYELIFEINLLANIYLAREPAAAKDFDQGSPFTLQFTPKNWLGNSLSFSDTTKFHFQIKENPRPTSEAVTLNFLREYARILTVKNINTIRPKKIEPLAKNPEIDLPKTICNLERANSILKVLSPGKAKGTLKTLANLTKTDKNIILYSENLPPDLTAYFPQISAILSQNGNLLSHLAIMAREAKIPLISGIKPSEIIKLIGQTIEIDSEKVDSLAKALQSA